MEVKFKITPVVIDSQTIDTSFQKIVLTWKLLINTVQVTFDDALKIFDKVQIWHTRRQLSPVFFFFFNPHLAKYSTLTVWSEALAWINTTINLKVLLNHMFWQLF